MARWHPNHHHDQHPPGDHDADCCPDEPGVRIRPVTFAELEDYLEHLANPTQRPPLPRARLVGITSPPARVPRPARPPRSLGHGRIPASASGRLAELETHPAPADRRRTGRRGQHRPAHGRGRRVQAGLAHRAGCWRSTGLVAALSPHGRHRGLAARRPRRTAHRPAAGSPGTSTATRSSTTWPSPARPPTSTTWSSAPPGCS